MFHKHKWDYELHNNMIIRSCKCGKTQETPNTESVFIKSTSPIPIEVINKAVWKDIPTHNYINDEL